MQINVGEWIRTKQGSIHKAKSIYKDMIWYCDVDYVSEIDIVNHSENFIDLIQERRLYKQMQSIFN